jgi:hypothetical protein
MKKALLQTVASLPKQQQFPFLSLTSSPSPSDISELRAVGNANMIVTTPEKWDSMTRTWRDNLDLMKLVGLVLVDEVHCLGEERRGVYLCIFVFAWPPASAVRQIQNAFRRSFQAPASRLWSPA